MRLSNPPRVAFLLCAPLITAGLTACGSAVSTSGFKGEQHAVAQAIADLQSDATASDEKKICSNDLAQAVVNKLGGAKGCEKAIHDQLGQIDSLEVKVESIQISPAAAGATAKATGRLKSIYAGKHRQATVTLVKEGARWKVSGVQKA
jgi:hypothetical protein